MSNPVSPSRPPRDVPVGAGGIRVLVHESKAFSMSGWLALFGGLFFLLVGALLFFGGAGSGSGGALFLGVVFGLAGFGLVTSLQALSPGDTKVVQFFGRYIGTIRRTGLTWRIPLTTTTKVSVRVRNFETNALKVNDRNGSPVIISAVVVWQVADTAKSTFAVSDYENFIHTQAEAALRHTASSHPYDDSGIDDDTSITLRGNSTVITEQLASELAERISIAGLEVVEVRLSNLSYAPEIAGAMLQRQQAQALVDARRQIVQGAVGMTSDALKQLEQQVDGFALTEDQRTQMTSNLMMVIVGGSPVQPVVNTGLK